MIATPIEGGNETKLEASRGIIENGIGKRRYPIKFVFILKKITNRGNNSPYNYVIYLLVPPIESNESERNKKEIGSISRGIRRLPIE